MGGDSAGIQGGGAAAAAGAAVPASFSYRPSSALKGMAWKLEGMLRSLYFLDNVIEMYIFTCEEDAELGFERFAPDWLGFDAALTSSP